MVLNETTSASKLPEKSGAGSELPQNGWLWTVEEKQTWSVKGEQLETEGEMKQLFEGKPRLSWVE